MSAGKKWVTDNGEFRYREDFNPDQLKRFAEVVFHKNTDLQMWLLGCAQVWRNQTETGEFKLQDK